VASAGSTATVNLSWAAATGAAGYNIYRGTSAGGESPTPINASPVTSLNYTDTGLMPGGTYYYVVKAWNAGGSSASSGEASATTLPTAAAGLSASALSSSSISLSWTAATGATGYNIYRGTSAGGESATPVNGVPVVGTTFTDTGLAESTAYYYVVKAVNAGGSSAASNEATATTPASYLPSVTIFDDVMATGYAPSTGMSIVSTPVNSGTAAVGGTNTAAYQQLGIVSSGATPVIPVGRTTLQFALYITTASSIPNFIVQLATPTNPGTSYPSKYFSNISDASHSNAWTIDGQPATMTITANTWHTVRLDLATAFGTSLVAGSSKILNAMIQTSGTTGRSYYLDDVKLIDPNTPNGMARMASSPITNSVVTQSASPKQSKFATARVIDGMNLLQ
jgi:hypothetical protein